MNIELDERHPLLSPLNRRSVYLAGPIEHCTHDEKWWWRTEASLMLAPMYCFNPCNREFDMVNGNTDTISKQVVTLDKAEIAASDCLLVYYNPPRAGSMMTGTTMEIIYAFERGKLVVVVSDRKDVSSWVDYHCHARYETLDEACKFIRNFYTK